MKTYKLLGVMELLRMKEKQDERPGEEPPDWAHLEKVNEIKAFFAGTGPGDAGGGREGDATGGSSVGGSPTRGTAGARDVRQSEEAKPIIKNDSVEGHP